MTSPSIPLARELVGTACCAPSVHNTQPWSWRIVDATTIEQRADRSRQLAFTDPGGRDLALSCGAALHHLTVAADAFGLVADVTLLPDGSDPDLLARVLVSVGRSTEAAVRLMDALENRTTDRRGFTSWEVPPARLAHLAEAAAGWGAHAMPITDPGHVHRTLELIEKAHVAQDADPRYAAEQESWTGFGSAEGPHDGVPAANAVPHPEAGLSAPTNRFDPRTLAAGRFEGLLAVCTARDDQRSWLQAGMTMSAVWLQATMDGLAVLPSSQVVEVEATRRLLEHEVFADLARPQIVLGIGWPTHSHRPTSRSPRRSLEEVLEPSHGEGTFRAP